MVHYVTNWPPRDTRRKSHGQWYAGMVPGTDALQELTFRLPLIFLFLLCGQAGKHLTAVHQHLLLPGSCTLCSHAYLCGDRVTRAAWLCACMGIP